MKGEYFKTDSGKYYLVKCPECGEENYSLAVASGICAWCGFDINKFKEEECLNTREQSKE